ncbi:ABC transport ATP-binding protein [Ligilactobacillus acidipiscis DSM 15836]|uniref:ABC transport ATP-binding protein n=1 Tax=Ligilactobacillus acidipiscis DSM 15836 TaxID=1423716 RepID=A0ABR5PLX1_9LACO|nr:energy-coupling factor ABC transporter ATP-binding protein [Ligilactobacillus acidipiscis]KRM30972.1 ABC transport ATP-binding protein [Ligilactobacillus acidipiscis DSM 15836]GAW63940.1 energy-coupling factor transporter ATP-binding protein [Ligilactobacillus acidipiscis]GEN20382.1 energy-coupling factor transporter ATP-binding protein EcfA1 [Ligilactobacillus acidipiscis]
MNGIIDIKDLCFRYSQENEKLDLSHIDLHVNEGEWLAIIGHNGSGKSTLAKAIDGLIEPEAGEVFIDGEKLTDKSLWNIRKKIGMVFQNPDNQFVGADVEGDVAFGLENQGIEREEMHARVKKALEVVDMQNFAKHEPVRLSGGQKQRVAIAGVLALRPKIVIFDESTSMLDPEGRLQIISLIRQMNQIEGFTVISITHDIDEASLADRVIVIDDGQIIDDSLPEKLFQKGEQLIDIGLDVPYPQRLKLELKKRGIQIPAEYMDEESMVNWLCRSILKN